MNYYKNINIKIAFAGIMFGLVLLFQYLERFMPFGETYLNINLSLIFIMATYYVLGWRYALIILILRFVIGPAVGKYGYSDLGMWSHFILLISGITYMLFFVTLDNLFKRFKKINSYTRVTIVSVLSTLASAIILTLLNGLLFSPMFWYLLSPRSVMPEPTISAAMKLYAQPFVHNVAFFGVKNYWGGIFAVFISGNIVKYSIISVGFVGLWKTLEMFRNTKRLHIKTI